MIDLFLIELSKQTNLPFYLIPAGIIGIITGIVLLIINKVKNE